ncbi:MAG TPA: R3H domain-containing nucleic acid-binding protein [Patescibacteria group bacterium]|nr:R3H domain-containing nucleic acid-binding protein [Patescibacteria group bacterium]
MTDYDKITLAKTAIEELLQRCGVRAAVEFEESITKGLIFNISSPDSYLLIGRQGATLHALQVLAQALVARRLSDQQPLWFSLDVDDYKRKREWFLKETAKAAADKAKMTGRPQGLEPMPNYERRLVHAYLQEHCPNVESYSTGREPHRKIIVRLKQ